MRAAPVRSIAAHLPGSEKPCPRAACGRWRTYKEKSSKKMRLHLDTGSKPDATVPAGALIDSAGDCGSSARLGAIPADTVGLSGVSAAWNRLASERTARISQLAIAVQNGSYHVPSAAVSA